MSVIHFLNKKEIEKFIDPVAHEVVDYMLKKIAFSQPEVLKEEYFGGIQITKEFLEGWISQACGLNMVGAGNYPIDVYKNKDYGADVKFVTAKVKDNGELKNSQSNETSLGQNFSDAGVNLDQMFERGEHQLILDKWKEILKTKLNRPLKEYGLNKIFYFIFIRGKNKIYMAIARVESRHIKELTVGDTSKTSVFVHNYVLDKYGKVKIYKSKKRMELRLFPKQLHDDGFLVEWSFDNLDPDVVSLRSSVKKKELKTHLKGQSKKFFNI